MVVVKMMDSKRKWMIVNAIEKTLDGRTIAKCMNFKIHTSNYYQPLT